MESFGCQTLKRKCLRYFVLLSTVQQTTARELGKRNIALQNVLIVTILYLEISLFYIFLFIEIPDINITKYLLLISCSFKGNAKKFVFFSYNMNKVIGNSHAGLMHFYTKGRLLVQLITGSLHFFLGFFR